jgi:MFS transporter, OFA family, oxalate/formate antiporter
MQEEINKTSVSGNSVLDTHSSLPLALPVDPFERSDRIKGILTLVGGFSLMLYLGCFFLWGNIDIYVLSYFHEFNPNLSISFIYLVDLFLVGANCIGYNIGTYFLNHLRMPPKVVIAIGSSVALAGIYASSFTKSLPPYLTLYTFLNGLGSGTCYLVPLICGWEYFPERKGLVTGLILGAYGFGSFGFSLLSTALVNPTHEKATIEDPEQGITYFGPEVADRVPYMIRTLVYVWIGLVAIAILLISRKPRARVLASEARRVLEKKNE